MADPRPLVLASASPRRRALLAPLGLAFDVQPANHPEQVHPGEDPRDLVERLATEKARVVAAQHPPEAVVLGSDTSVVIDGDILGKPDDQAHAVALLRRLVGRTHRVLTGVALVSGGGEEERVLSVESLVTMRPADDGEIRRYVATGEPLDKAGAYALQGGGRRFVERVEGSESNVIGLPLDETCALLREFGFAPTLPDELPECT